MDNFLIPTLLLHQFERSEREGDIHLKQQSLERMLKYFFLAGHVQYARYMTQHLLEMRALSGTDARPSLVCRHHNGYWKVVSADQFGELKMGKGALKGMMLSSEIVSEWIEAFPITVKIVDSVDNMYAAENNNDIARKEHKEEMKHRKVLNAADRNLIHEQIEKYPHPLEEHQPHLFNHVSGQVAHDCVNVADSL